MHIPEDDNILKRIRSGDKQLVNASLRDLYKLHFPFIASYVKKNNGTEESAADVFQDALIAFYKNALTDDFKLSCTIKTYLFSISRNLWLKQLRKAKREVALSEENIEVPIEESGLSILYENEREAAIAKLMGSLDPSCREVLKLYYFDRLKMKEIARILNLSNEQVAKNKKSACMKKLRSLVDRYPALKSIIRE